MELRDDLNPNDPDFFELVVGSYRRLVGRELVTKDQGPEWLYGNAPFAVLAHNGEIEPKFVYANATAQRLFGYSWGEFTTLKSKFSAAPAERSERQALLDAVSRDGFIENYRGLRITKSGSRFWMEDGTVWQLRDKAGRDFGQAAMFSKWHGL